MGEYIDKAEALSRFSFYNGDRIPERDVDGFPNTITFHDAKAVIRSIRPADVRPAVRGRWVKSHAIVGIDTKTCDVKIGETDKCSVCGEEFVRPIKEYKFCPNCGADMRGE